MMRDLQDRGDIADLVTGFYRRAFDDELIGPIFTDVAHLDLDHHLPIMCDFWETVLFRAGLYARNAFDVHVALDAKVALEGEHFERWLAIWVDNVDEHFAGEKAERAKTQAARIAASIHRRLQGGSGSAFETLKRREASWVRVCADADLAPNAPLQVVIGGVPIVVVRGSDGVVHALDDTCTHAQVSLSEGLVEDDEIECGAHGAAFDLASGAALSLPATRALRVYPVTIEAGDVVVSSVGRRAEGSDADAEERR